MDQHSGDQHSRGQHSGTATAGSDPVGQPAQTQAQCPGHEEEMTPKPIVIREDYRGSGKLAGKVAVITGGDSGIGRSVAVHFAREGADVMIAHLPDEREDATETEALVQAEGRRCHRFAGDLGDPSTAERLVAETMGAFGRLDILVNNAAEQHPQEGLEEIEPAQLERTFRTNVFAQFFVTRAALAHMGKDGVILCTTSVTAYRGNANLLDYSATKGAVVAFVRALAQNLADRGIRVNGVAPGPVWTPLIPSTFDAEKTAKFGTNEPLGRAGQPADIAPAFVFLAARDGAYMTGQILHPNGGEAVGG